MQERRRQATVWTRGLCAMALAGPALGLGAVHPWSLLPIALTVLAWIFSLRGAPKRWPLGLWILVGLALITALQALPLPGGLVAWLAPVSHNAANEAWPNTAPAAWAALSIAPDATAFEAARLCVLAAAAWAAAQTPWQRVAEGLAIAGLAVLVVGLVHLSIDAVEIYGLYSPRTRPGTAALLTSFINPNHQAGLFLLAAFSAWALRQDHLSALEREDTTSIAWGLAALALAGGIALSVSRGGALALIIGIAATLGLRANAPPMKARLALSLLAATALVLALVAFLLPAFVTRLIALWGVAGSGAKFETAGTALQLVSGAPWLGTGRGTMIDLLPVVGLNQVPVTTHVEVAPVTMLIEWGPVVALLALGLWARAMFVTVQRRRDARRVLALGLVAWALHNTVDFNWEYMGTALPAAALFGTLAPRVRPPPLHGERIAVALCAIGLAGAAIFASRADPLAPPVLRAASEQSQRSVRPLDARAHLARARQQLAAANASESPLEREQALALASTHAASAERLRASVDAALLNAELNFARKEYADFADALGQAWSRADAAQRRSLAIWLVRDPDPVRTLAIAARPPQPAIGFFTLVRGADPAWAESFSQGRLVYDDADPAALETLARIAQAQKQPRKARDFAARWAAAAPSSGAALSSYALAKADHDPTQARAALDLLKVDANELDQGELVIMARAHLRLRLGEALLESKAELQDALARAPNARSRESLLKLLRRVNDALNTSPPRG